MPIGYRLLGTFYITLSLIVRKIMSVRFARVRVQNVNYEDESMV